MPLVVLAFLCEFVSPLSTLAVEYWVVGNALRPWSSAGSSIALDDTTELGVLQPIDVTGKNVCIGAKERGGWIDVNWLQTKGSVPLAIDGDPNTLFPATDLDQRGGFPVTIIVDLGVPFAVDSVSFYAPKGYENFFLSGYEIFVDSRDEELVLPHLTIGWYEVINRWNLVARDPLVEDTIVVGNAIPFQLARRVAISDSINTNILHWVMAELEVWGVGYPLRAKYTSDIVDLGKLVNLGVLRWSGGSDPESWMRIRTRVGKTPDPNLYYELTGIGLGGQKEVSRSDYEKLRPMLRGSIAPDLENWTFWSAPYQASGQAVVSEGPARYVQFEILFQSNSPLSRSWVDSLFFEYSSELLAQEVVGEISPAEVVPGEVTVFTYALRASFNQNRGGFDALRVSTPDSATVSSLRVNGEPVAFSAEREDGGFTVRFPQHGLRREGEVLEVEFATRVFVNGTRFSAEVFDTESEDIPQKVVPGDASPRLESDDMLVGWPLRGESLLADVEVSPEVLTPNGDGINDTVEISYSFLQVLSPIPVTLEIFDLTGAVVWRVEAPQNNGHYTFRWDGTRLDGERPLPGIYVYRLVAHTEKGDQIQTGTIDVVY